MYVRRLKPKTIETHTLVKNMKKTGLIKEKTFKDINFSFMNLNTYYKLGSEKIKKTSCTSVNMKKNKILELINKQFPEPKN